MKTSNKISILDELNNYYKAGKNENNTISWEYLHKLALGKFKENRKDLTEEAINEAEDGFFELSSYTRILNYLKNTRYEMFTNNIAKEYQKGKIDIQKFFKDKKINGLAQEYQSNKKKIPIQKLMLMNPAETVEEYNKKGVLESFQRKTTFVHQLFENGAQKEDIMYFFNKLNGLSFDNPDLVKDYLALSDENGKSITEILQERSLDEKYMNIFSDIKISCPMLYPLQENIPVAGVDTHTHSVHLSVDESFVKLSQIYDTEAISIESKTKVLVNRDENFDQKINNDIAELKEKLIELTTSNDAIENLVKESISSGEVDAQLCMKFKFQAEAALRMVQGLQEGKYGNRFEVDATTPVSCGLSLKEIVAIAYSSLKKRDLWENKEQETSQFMQFIEGMYVAKRGYNIDQYGDTEWLNYSNIKDNNKCLGGAVNQIASSLRDNKLVKVKIINPDIMLPIVYMKLQSGILQDLCQNEDRKNLIVNWLNRGVLSDNLRDEILERLINDNDFKANFTQDQEEEESIVTEINNTVLKVLNKFNGAQLQEIKSKLSNLLPNQNDVDSLNDLSVHSFVFNKKKGYILTLEHIYDVDKNVFHQIIERELNDSITERNIDSADAKKMNSLINLILNSENEEMTKSVDGIFNNHIKDLPQWKKDEYFLYMARSNNNSMLIPLIKSGSDVNAIDRSNNKENVLHYIAQNGNASDIKALIDLEVNIDAKDQKSNGILDIAARYNDAEVIKLLIEEGINIKANYKALHLASRYNNAQAIKVLINSGFDVNGMDAEGSPLHISIRYGNTQAIRALVKAGANIDIKDSNKGMGALHYAAQYSNGEIMNTLVKACSDINAVDKKEDTALHISAKYENIEAMKALIEGGANTEIKNAGRSTPLSYSVEEKLGKSIRFFIEDGRVEPLDIKKINRMDDGNEYKVLLKAYFYKKNIMRNLEPTSHNYNLSQEIAALPKDIQSELVRQIKPEITKFASSNLGAKIGDIISYFTESSRIEYFKDVVLESIIKIGKNEDPLEINKILKPFKDSDKRLLRATFEDMDKMKYADELRQEKNIVSPDDVNLDL